MTGNSRWACLLVWLFPWPVHAAHPQAAGALSVAESARAIPVVYDVDVVVVGGSTGAVSAASEAARRGASVFLLAPRPYLGEDLCATLRLWRESTPAPLSTEAVRLLGDQWPPTPMEVKRRLDDALLAAGVRFLYSCYPTELLRDAAGNVAGIVMANRCGRQAVRAKVVVDATEHAVVARLAGARFRPYPAGKQAFRWVVVGGQPHASDDCVVRQLDRELAGQTAYEYTLSISMLDGSFPAFAEAEQIARDRTFDPDQTDWSQCLFQVPPDAMQGQQSVAGAWPGAERIDLGAFRPAGVQRVYVLSGCADVSRTAAELLVRPATLIDLGRRIGVAAGDEARASTRLSTVVVTGETPEAESVPGNVCELLAGVRPGQQDLGTVPSTARTLPIWGKYDVVVAGGGTSGAPAAIAAARGGARTLVVEVLPALGGVGTVGGINRYWHGNRVGFFDEVERGVAAVGARIRGLGKAEYWRRQCRQAGADVWLSVLVCGAVVDHGTVRGVIVATPQGRAVVLAKVVIDATANADVAAAAGAECLSPGGGQLAMQMAGMPFRQSDQIGFNTAFTFADDNDLIDLWQTVVTARQRWNKAYDLGQLVQTRARRSIAGDLVLTPVDQHAHRTFPDSVALCYSNFDKYNFPVHPLYLIRTADKNLLVWSYVPYRCWLPRGFDGLLVIGLGKSADSDAMTIVRMQADLQNEGYAAGLAAAMSVDSGVSVRHLDVRKLQRQLVAMGNLPADVLQQEDSLPPSRERVEQAVRRAGALGYEDLAVVLAADRDVVLPQLRAAHAQAAGETQVSYARILGVLGDPAGAPTLVRAVGAASWDDGQNIQPYGNRGANYSQMDQLVIALGLTGDRTATGPLTNKLRQLDGSSSYSHFRAMAIAWCALRDPAAAQPLAELLSLPGMTGHAITTIDEARQSFGEGEPRSSAHLNERLRELLLAGALYRCGDCQGVGESILREYRQDLCGYFARYAAAALQESGR